MDIEEQKKLNYENNEKPNNSSKTMNSIKFKIVFNEQLIYIYCAIIFLIKIGMMYYLIRKDLKNIITNLPFIVDQKLLKFKNYLYSKKYNNIRVSNISYIEFNETIYKKLKEEQDYFCNYQYLFYNEEYEKKIRLVKINLNDLNFNHFIYKKKDFVSLNILRTNYWELNETNNLINALNYYSDKKNIKKEDIYIFDVGSNIGWYSIVLGKYGYKIFSFEPSEMNEYIFRKSHCLNSELNITLINKGLSTEEKQCSLYNLIGNEGNGMVICDTNKTIPKFLNTNKTGEIILTRLSNFIPFFITKNLILIKIDVEGAEGKVLEGGIELITKYHIPFIFLEFTPYSLKLHGTDPIKFLEMFENNGYKISIVNFLAQKYSSINDIIKMTKELMNLYIVYPKVFE